MKEIYDSTTELISFVNNILDISKLETGKMQFRYEKEDIRIMSETIVDTFRALYEQKAISITLTDTLKNTIIDTDKEKYRLVLNNLLSNAYKFTPEKGTVTVTLTENRGRFKVLVKDSGIGMSEETQKHIFEKFNQSSHQDYTKKSIAGSGLGLHLVREILTKMDGSIECVSTLGKGTTMTAIIPMKHTEKTIDKDTDMSLS